MSLMEKTEASLVPGWLKAVSANTLSMSHSGIFQDNGNNVLYPRSKSQQIGGNIDSPRWSTSSDRIFFPVPRRAQSGNQIDKVSVDRYQGWVHSSLTRSLSSALSFDVSDKEREQERVRNEVDVFHVYDSGRDSDKDSRFRNVSVLDNSETDKDNIVQGKMRSSGPVMPGNYEPNSKLNRSQSMGLSSRISDSKTWKLNGSVNISSPRSSVRTTSVTTMHKTVFDRNFPSLGSDDKLLASSQNGSVLSPYTTWQSPSQMDISRTSSSGLSGGFNSLSLANGCGSGDVWNSALAQVPISTGSSRQNVVGVIGPPIVSSNSLTLRPTSTVLNMAEALAQTPPRVRTPPQVSTESQRLEELALKQSRQLIPVPPPLPKTMSLADKGKSKSSRALDGAMPTSKSGGSANSLSSHKSVNTTRQDTVKHSQGKLLVLRANKDNGGVNIASNSDGSDSNQVVHNGSNMAPSLPANAVSLTSQRTKLPDSRDVRPKDLQEEKKPSTQAAQNRTDFFNALRKKAATTGEVFIMALKSESPGSTGNNAVLSSGEALLTKDSDNACQLEKVDLGSNSHTSECKYQAQNNGILGHAAHNGIITDKIDSLVKERQEDGIMDSEEEEAAFMRSLGWEENAEDGELTEEEINSFYQLMKEKKLLTNVNHCNGGLESLESTSSSDSDSDFKSMS